MLTGKNNRSRQNEKCSAVSAVTYARDSTSGIDNQDDLMVRLFPHLKLQMFAVIQFLSALAYAGYFVAILKKPVM